MNCKPGDLAVTVATNNSRTSIRNSGRLVEVLKFVGAYVFSNGTIGVNVWMVRVLGAPLVAASGRTWGPEVYIQDANLRPLRDPGSDAKDETLTWLKDKVDA